MDKASTSSASNFSFESHEFSNYDIDEVELFSDNEPNFNISDFRYSDNDDADSDNASTTNTWTWTLSDNNFQPKVTNCGITDMFVIEDDNNIWNPLQVLNTRYPIYKLSNPFFSAVQINNPDDVQIFLSSKKHLRKSFMYKWLENWLGTGLLTSSEHSDILVTKIEEECDKSYTELTSLISHFTLKVICETSMGIKLDENEKSTSTYMNTIFRLGIILFQRIRRPWLYINFFNSQRRNEELNLIKTLHHFSRSVIEKRKNSFLSSEVVEYEEKDGTFKVKTRLALLDLLLTLKHHGADISDEGIREEVDTFIFEGHDTTAMALSFALMLIANYEKVQDKILHEIREVIEDSDRKLTLADLQRMQYTDRVLKESLRLYPSVPVIGRITDSIVQTATGYTIPKDTFISLHIYGIHHNPKYFPNPENFDPDRFLPENCSARHPFSYIPFSAGPRNCIGQRFAVLELKAMLISIIRNFKVLPVDKPANLHIFSHLTIKPKDGIKVKFQKRL
ncbi:hypothetical protein FQA39_LY17515 [Lamprigera yunnana]|nr:hypothetical protein FQA39_LY17515 [Lamprigera yunnana]